MLRRLGIRGKILAVIVVPIMVLALAAGIVTYNAFTQLQVAQNASHLVGMVDNTRDFLVAFREERDAGANYVASWNDLSTQAASARTAVDAAMTDLETLAATDSRAASVKEEIDAAFFGGVTVPGGEPLTLAEARDVGPVVEPDEWPVWPTEDQAGRLADSYSAMHAAVVEASEGVAADSNLGEILGRVQTNLAQEGDRSYLYVTVPAAFQERYRSVAGDVDTAWSRANGDMEDVAQIERNEAVIAQTTTVRNLMELLPGIRENVRDRGLTPTSVVQWYSGVTNPLIDLTSIVALVAGDSALSLELNAYNTMDEMFEQLSVERNFVERLIRTGFFGVGDVAAARGQFTITNSARDDAQAAVSSVSTSLQVPPWGASFDIVSGTSFASIRNLISGGIDSTLATVADQDWTTQVDEEKAAQQPAYDGTLSRSLQLAADTEQASLFQTVVTAIIAIAAIVASILIALIVARRIVVPLRRLTTTATAVRQELPRLVERVALPGETVDVAEVQIPVESQDEVGRLAEAFNGVNAATLAIAGEQAALRGSISEMFVNVARRDQVLLNRQLQSIDEMERTEDNPSTLTKLFALDHLATRMRRNSESLLVLAGIDTGRRLRRSMPLSDVIRTASSEIELYERVDLELDADPAMLGHSSLTAAHLFAELLENATVFSDPGTPVVVSTHERDGSYVVEIKDSGIGMTPSELEEANNRVVSTAASEILGAQRLGLFVVGRIARRIGARVTLESAEGAGTTATVFLARSLFDTTVSVDPTHTADSNVDETLHAPAALVTHTIADETFAEPGEAPLSAYQPTSVADGAPLVVGTVAGAALAAGAADAGAGDAEGDLPIPVPGVTPDAAAGDVADLIAADAADAPIGVPVDTEALTEGVGPTGLPTRRRREAPAPVEDESTKVIGLPVRATADQLSALESAEHGEAFAPSVSANEVSPQTPEERASMFRGFRARRDLAAEAENFDPEAESLGHAARRGAIAPEEIPALAAPVVPELADEEVEEPAADAPESGTPAVPLLEEDDFPTEIAAPAAAAAAAALVIPLLEDDDEPSAEVAAPTAPEPASEALTPELEPDVVEPVGLATPAYETPAFETPAFETPDYAAPAYTADQLAGQQAHVEQSAPASFPAQPVAEAAPQAPATFEALPAATPFSYADAYASTPQQEVVPQQPWGVDEVSLDDVAPRSLDDIIAEPSEPTKAKAGFFARLFGRGKGDAAPAPAPASATPVVAPSAEPLPVRSHGFEPDAPVAERPFTGFAPVADGGAVPPPVVEPQQSAWAEQPSPSVPSFDAPAPAASPSPGGAFALWEARPEAAPEAVAPAAVPAPAAPAPAPLPDVTTGQVFTPDELANPYGWEAAGGAALAASQPEVETEYQPVVDAQDDALAGAGHAPEFTSEAFSELSSLSVERPKVEKTRAGLQRRRAPGAAAPEVKPIEPEVQVAPKERDANAVRTRFSSFYSGTQRARHDVEEFEQRSRPAEVKE